MPKVRWKLPVESEERLKAVEAILRKYGVNTICWEARCPNIDYCFSKGTATFLLMGRVCTRRCGYCATETGRPEPLDPTEPERVALASKEMGLKYVVVTSVTRDDLEDGGASHFAKTIRAIREMLPYAKVEALVPDFRGKRQSLDILLDSFPPDVLCVNVEVVRRLYPKVRPAGKYEWVLDLLAYAKEKNPKLITKSSLIVGLGETDEEVWETLRDLALCRVDIVTVGLYLMPSRGCVRPSRIVFEDTFRTYEEWGRKLGIPVVISGPLVRSSFKAEEAYAAAVGVMKGEKGGCDKSQG